MRSGNAESRCYWIEWPTTPGKRAVAQWVPRDEADGFGVAVIKHGFMLAVGDIVVVLHRCDWRDCLRALQLFQAHFRQADVPHFALVLQFRERINRHFNGH